MDPSLMTNQASEEDFFYWDDTFKLEDHSQEFSCDQEKSPLQWIKLELFDGAQSISSFPDSNISYAGIEASLDKLPNLSFISECHVPWNTTPTNSSKTIEPPVISVEGLSKQGTSKAKFNFVYICQLCYFIFKTRKEIEKHAKKHHAGMSRFKKQRLDIIPDDSQSDSSAKTCVECNTAFNDLKELLKHHLTHKTVTKCVICNLQCICHAKLQEHYRIHHDASESFACYACNKRFKLERYVRVHMRKKHPIQDSDIGEFSCHYCSFVAVTQNILESHMSLHGRKLVSKSGSKSPKHSRFSNCLEESL